MYHCFHDSTVFFNQKPLKKKLHQQEQEIQIKKKLEKAISQCLSSYMKSQLNTNNIHQTIRPRPKTKRETANYDHQDQTDLIMEDLNEYRRLQIEEKISLMSNHIKQQLYGLVCQLLEMFSKSKKRYASQDKSVFAAQQSVNQEASLLNQSNRNFIIELFADLGLLKIYKGMNRTFIKLVNQAQKTYFKIRTFLSTETQPTAKEKNHEVEQSTQLSLKQINNYDFHDTANTFSSMKKRLFEAQSKNIKIEKTLQQTENVTGYEIFEADNYILDEEILLNNPTDMIEDSLSSKQKFTQSNSLHKKTKRKQNSNTILNQLDHTHRILVEFTRNWGSQPKQDFIKANENSFKFPLTTHFQY